MTDRQTFSGSDTQPQLGAARASITERPPGLQAPSALLTNPAMAKTAGRKLSLVDLPENVILKIQVAAGDPAAVYGMEASQVQQFCKEL